ncbi:alanyl-tRNA synthetase [Catalinimonas alkaloidigena]|uniref:alanine--tRNA ligase n=1 Tax=Catalinimonas alkaloidigena TaxID=1075417 RepID=UPI0024064439|nr:alanine--tRNA ligase [Catalinimonas alkaloidigena]MDF9799574.1 alanyl-tRNA synthetase [Catalinimonas alkaloidigena]
MNSQEIRTTFIQFFESKKHQFVPSAPIVTKNDPTLMFTNAGMNQFKDYFLGNKPAPNTRVANSQKCLRVSGKHNDLEEVGIDTYHHTMFEMLGNWSFGDYFKKEAISWAWELLTEVYKLPKDRLYVTVFGGDKGDNLPVDQEAYDHWKNIIEESRILYGNKKDNFWEMGDTGPCGPCSEIHIDLRSQKEVDQTPGKALVNQDHPLVVEIWNLVFMQFNRQASGELKPLPAKHVDTGMGFERLAMAIQKAASTYDTDIFTPLITQVSVWAGVKYGEKKETDIALRVIVDHIRAISFAIADGQLPSNNKAGYVIRRILRRAVRYGYTFLNFKEPFLYRLLPTLSEQFADIFPELPAQNDFVAKVIQEEEASFLRTLEIGLRKLDQIKQEYGEQKIIPGAVAFELYDTYGFPLDLTALIARESGLSVDEKGFQQEMEKQKKRSKGAATVDTGDWVTLLDEDEITFVGYDSLLTEAQIVRYRQLKEKNKTYYQLVLNRTPFYPEGGGQVGDTGYLEADGKKTYIIDTKKENDLIIHYAKELPEDVNATFQCVVNEEKRLLTMNNHSATHLLHAALKQVLGDHVQQKGSLVNDHLLRFDFSHFARMSEEEIRRVEHIVNQKIRANIALEEMRNVPMAEAKEMGATALFGEKYGDFVRVIAFDRNYSLELCGGTHVPSTGNIGLFKIVSESSISAGVRRLEAISADAAEAYVYEQEDLMKEIKETLKNPANLKKAVETLVNERNQLQKEIESLQQKEALNAKDSIINKAYQLGEIKVIVDKVSLPNADMLKKLSFDIKNQLSNLILVLAADVDGKPQIAMSIDESLIKAHNLHAGNMVRELAKNIKGGGGGQPFFATAGGKDVSGLDNVLTEAKKMIEEKINKL